MVYLSLFSFPVSVCGTVRTLIYPVFSFFFLLLLPLCSILTLPDFLLIMSTNDDWIELS